MTSRTMRTNIAAGLLTLGLAAVLQAGEIAVEWEPPLDPTAVARYQVYYSTGSLLGLTTGQATASLAVRRLLWPGDATEGSIRSLMTGGVYRARLTALAPDGSESGFNLSMSDLPEEVTMTATPEVLDGHVALEAGAANGERRLTGLAMKVRVRVEAVKPGDTLTLWYSDPNGESISHQAALLPMGDGVFEGVLETWAMRTGAVRYYVRLETEAGDVGTTPERVLILAREVSVDRNEQGVFRTAGGEVELHMAFSDGFGQLTVTRRELAEIQGVFPAGAKPWQRALATAQDTSIVYELSVPGQSAVVLSRPALLKIYYNDQDQDGIIDGTSVKEDSLGLFWHDGITGWRFISDAVDEDANALTAQVPHLGVYGVFEVDAAAVASYGLAAQETFLSPGLADGINDTATFGPLAQEVRVFDLAGRLVFEATQDDLGGSTIGWNGKDTQGNELPSGVYIAGIRKKDGGWETQKLVLVK